MIIKLFRFIKSNKVLIFQRGLRDPVNPRWLNWGSGRSKMADSGFQGAVFILESYWLRSCRSIRSLRCQVVFPLNLPCAFTPKLPYVHLSMSRGQAWQGGRGKRVVAIQPKCTYFQNPSQLHLCTRRRGKGLCFEDFARGRIFSNNDVAINIQSQHIRIFIQF